MQTRPTGSGVKNLLAVGVFVEVGILLLAALLRLWGLDLKAPHFDEGINGWFVDQMKIAGFYRYDPENYHGPLYFYILFVFLSLLGRNLWALRLPAAIASLASVWVILRFDRFLGLGTARLAALALAVSPAAVFYGRYAIHESWLVLSLIVATLGILGLWREGGRRDLFLTVTGITMMLLLKETAVIHLGCFVIAGGCLLLWQQMVPSRPAAPFAVRKWSDRDLGQCLLLALVVLIFFYSGNFLNWYGLPDFFRAYLKWFQTGTGAGGHEKADYQFGHFAFLNWYWVSLMVRYEWPALLGLLFALRLAWPSPAMLRWLGIYTVGVLMAYSIVPYKTPWCIISILWPFALLFGAALEELQALPRMRIAAAAVAAALLSGSLILSLRLNFRHYTDPKEPYVYVQTMPGISVITAPLLGMAAHDPRNHALSGEILLESYYPLPWILGDFTRIGYYGKDHHSEKLTGDFITAPCSNEKEVESKITAPYLRRRYHLRDSMDECTVWFRESVFAPWFVESGHGKVERVLPTPLPAPSPAAHPDTPAAKTSPVNVSGATP
jgi:uncharacterized protein (TIGR03663 family)